MDGNSGGSGHVIKQGAASVLIQAIVLCVSHGFDLHQGQARHHSDSPGNFTPPSTPFA